MSEGRLGSASDPLAADRRRYFLYCLHLYSTPMTLADVAEQVLSWEHAGRPEDYLGERLRLYNDLYHEHLPVLVEAGLVDYDQGDDMVTLGPEAAAFEPRLERHLSTELGDLLHAEHGALEGLSSGPCPSGLYRALAAPERRRALRYLLDRSRVSLEDLADVVAGEAPDEPRERALLLAALRDTHLPVLESVGLVEFDSDVGTVTLAALTDPVRAVIRSAVPADTDRLGRR